MSVCYSFLIRLPFNFSLSPLFPFIFFRYQSHLLNGSCLLVVSFNFNSFLFISFFSSFFPHLPLPSTITNLCCIISESSVSSYQLSILLCKSRCQNSELLLPQRSCKLATTFLILVLSFQNFSHYYHKYFQF